MAREVCIGQANFITIAPALNWATISSDMKQRINSEAISPSRGLAKRARNRSGTVMAPVRWDNWAIRLPNTAKAVIGTTM